MSFDWKKIVYSCFYNLVLSQSMNLNPRFQSICGSCNHSQSGSGFSNVVMPARSSGLMSFAVDALVRLSASMLAGELRRGTWRAKMRHSRKQETRCRALIP